MSNLSKRIRTMRLLAFLVFAPFIATALAAAADVPTEVENPSTSGTKASSTGLCLPFLCNEGQVAGDAAYYTTGFAGTLFVTRDGAIVHNLVRTSDGDRVAGVVLREELIGGRAVAVRGSSPAELAVSVFKGRDPEKWRSSIPAFEAVSLGCVYPGIHMELRKRGANVEKVFHLDPGTDSGAIQVRVHGCNGLHVNEAGELVAATVPGPVTFSRPIAYQDIKGQRIEVPVSYVVDEESYGFFVGAHDRGAPLVIDPLLASTFLGGGLDDVSLGLATATDGSVYVCGYTATTDFPTTSGAYDTTYNSGPYDAFIARFDHDLMLLTAATFLGGDGGEEANAIVIDASGDVLVAGNTRSDDFPTTPGAFNETYNGTVPGTGPYPNGGDIFVSRLDADLATLVASTFLGGSHRDYCRAVALDASGNVCLSGFTSSTDFPASPGAYQTTKTAGGFWGMDGYAARLDGGLAVLAEATYIGGTRDDFIEAMAIAGDGSIYTCGWTSSLDYPTTSGAYDTTYNGHTYDGFVSRFGGGLSALSASTYIGGASWDFCYALTLDSAGGVYAGGHTASSDFPATVGAFDETYNGVGGPGAGDDAFASRFDAGLAALVASTFMGGQDWEHVTALCFDGTGHIYASGSTSSSDYPVTVGAYDTTYAGGSAAYYGDIFVSRIDTALTAMTASTYVGGTEGERYSTRLVYEPAVGGILLAGSTQSSGYPAAPSAFDRSYDGGWDAVVSRFDALLTADTLTSDSAVLSAGAGGPVGLTLVAGSGNAGRDYLVCGSMSGTSPGTTLPGGAVVIPINRDPVTDYIYRNLGSPMFVDFQGVLDASGSGAAQLVAPPLPAAWIGRTLCFAYATVAPWDFASNAVAVEIVP